MTFETFFSALFHIQYSVVIWVGGFGGLKDLYVKHNTVIITLQIKCK